MLSVSLEILHSNIGCHTAAKMQLRSKFLKAAIQKKIHNILHFGKQEDKPRKHKPAYSTLKKKNLREK